MNVEFDRVARDFVTPDGRPTARSMTCRSSSLRRLRRHRRTQRLWKVHIAEHRCGLVSQSAGRVSVGGRDLEGLYRAATYMFQQDALLPWKTVPTTWRWG
jgi:hypothetical protein